MRWAKLSLARLEKLAWKLDSLAGNAEDEKREIAELIDKELDYLYGLTCGEDRYTGMLQALADPKLAELNLAL
jgi:hypothetical protein